jgi:hypothetical protein
MKTITQLASIAVLTAAIGLGITAPGYAGTPMVAEQGASDYSTANQSGCRHPDRSKCRRDIHRPAQVEQPVQEEQQSAESRREGTRRCLKGLQPHRSPRRC